MAKFGQHSQRTNPSPVFAWLNLKAEVDEVMLTFADQGLLLSSAVNIQRKNQRDLEVVIRDIMKED